ncbi:uncharacterized protein OCT59_026815 [Rhizophagus irregularis]|uniref:uncharacterized protein n=1 Tax=Rhizophagus irregularis TaxID=588596 RepID=UPI0033259BBD|nr:hypothetical protein OCT59_026815 [Rhizophagus irregularis]
MAHSFQIRCRILLAAFKVRMLKLERGAITAISNGGGRVAAAITVVIRSWIIRNIFVVSNFCDKILLIHVFWLVGRGVKQLSQLLWNVSGQMNKDMNVNGHYLITSTFREVLIYIFYEDISQDYIGRSLLWIQKILVNLISFCDMFKVWVTY